MTDVKYYTIIGGRNVVRAVGVVLSHLDHETGEWVENNTLFDNITFEASTKEITEKKAKDWVAENHLGLSVEWL